MLLKTMTRLRARHTHSRRQTWKRKVWIWLLLVSGFAVVAPHASAAPPAAIIHPTGLFPDDVQNVQEAVDAGGTILLKATDANGELASFNFGPATTDGGSVLLTNDVVVLGEISDGHMTTIDGGNQSFAGFGLPVNSAFRGIHFNGPRTGAVVMSHSSGFEFSECWVHDVIGLPFYPETKGQAVWMNGPPGGITGRLRIAGNLVEDIHAEVGYGFAIFGYDAEAEIIGNAIFGANTAGILVGLNSQPTQIEDNLIVPGPERFPFGTGGNGIVAVRPTAATGTYRIADNVVVCENPLADGIYLLGVLGGFGEQPVANSVIEKNDVEMHASHFTAIALYGAVSNCVVRNNNIRGTGAYAMQIGAAFLGGPAANNRLIGNNISQFDAVVPSYDWGDMADVFLDVHSQDTVVSGLVGSVIDLGVDNRISAPK